MAQNLTKGQMEAEISKLLIRFEKEHIGRGPEGARSYIVADMAVVRLRGVLTPAERHLARDPNGSALIREMRLRLVEGSKALLEAWVQDLTGCRVLNLLTDVSTRTGEHILVFVFDQNLEDSFKDRKGGEEASGNQPRNHTEGHGIPSRTAKGERRPPEGRENG